MPYWLLVLYDGFADVVSGYMNGFVFLLESLGIHHDASVNLATGATLAMFGAVAVWIWSVVRAGLKRAAVAARQRLRRDGTRSQGASD